MDDCPGLHWWSVWTGRNKRCLEDVQNSLQHFKMNFLGLFYSWCEQSLLAQT